MFRQWPLAAAMAVLTLAGAAFAADPAKLPDPIKPSLSGDKTPPTVHVVVFRMKKDAPADAVEKVVADCHAMLETIPSVRILKVGRPAPPEQSTPKVAAHDYDVALVVFFDDPAGLKTYLDHDAHLKFVKMYEPYFDMDKLQVFDFSDQKK
jgi:hypothetical protein